MRRSQICALSQARFFFFLIPCGIENPYVRKHHMHLRLCKSELVKYIFFLVLSSIRTRKLPFSGPADCKFVYVDFKCFSLKVHTCRVSKSVNASILTDLISRAKRKANTSWSVSLDRPDSSLKTQHLSKLHFE